MVIVLLIWAYVLLVSVTIGRFVLTGCDRIFGRKKEYGIVQSYIAGTVILTVYAEIVSLFSGISLGANMIVLLVTVGILFFDRKNVVSRLKKNKNKIQIKEWILYALILLVVAFFTSRGVEHGDTGLYHAQAIRWNEEYGVVKGLGNLFANYAYNSAWLCYSALFSFRFLGGQSFHATNGLIMAMICCYSVYGLLEYGKHKYHFADAVRCSSLFYAMVICVVSMSPSTDLPSIYMIIYLLIRWCENLEEDKDSHTMAMLSVLAVYAISVKLSAAMIVLLVFHPLYYLIQEKKWKQIGIYLTLGIVVITPYLIRNVILSGWLLYPFEGLDLFSVQWKMPLQNLIVDKSYITVYARKTYDPIYLDQTVREWSPVWWRESDHYDRMLFLAQFFAGCLILVSAITQIKEKRRIIWSVLFLDLVIVINLVFWFLQAPFIRYGLAFLLTFPLLAVAHIQCINMHERISVVKVITVSLVVAIVTCVAPYWNHYVGDTMLFVKQHLTDANYLIPKEYEVYEVESYEVDGHTFYYGKDTDKTGYWAFPGAPTENIHVRMFGDDYGEGFYSE